MTNRQERTVTIETLTFVSSVFVCSCDISHPVFLGFVFVLSC